MSDAPIIHATRAVGSSRFLQLEQVDLEFSNGERRTFERLKGSGLGAVIIVPMQDEDTVLLVREYSVGVERYELGLPKGRLDRDETAEQGADRELKEEIGFGARELHILTNLAISPAYMTAMTHVVLARELYAQRLRRRRAGGTRGGAVEAVRTASLARPSRGQRRAFDCRAVHRARILGGTLRAAAMSGQLEALARRAAAIAQRAAAAILAIYRSDFAVQQKDDRSPLTAADLAAHRLIVAELAALTPHWPILSEESAAIAWDERSRWSRYWLVDPLDGTREFVKRNGEFTVNIALIDAHRPILGVVQTPVSGELACAWQGGGAWLTDAAGATRRVHTRPRPRTAPLTMAGSRSHGSAREAELLARLGPVTKVPLGSSLKFVRIAAAAADLYLRLGPTSEWDTAAGQCVLEEAGGAVLDLAGRPLRLQHPRLAAQPGVRRGRRSRGGLVGAVCGALKQRKA